MLCYPYKLHLDLSKLTLIPLMFENVTIPLIKMDEIRGMGSSTNSLPIPPIYPNPADFEEP